MFINCPYCRALVATNPVTDEPPEQCPRCAATLRAAKAESLPRAAVPADEPVAEDRPAEAHRDEAHRDEAHRDEAHRDEAHRDEARRDAARGAETESAGAALVDVGPAEEALAAAEVIAAGPPADEAGEAAAVPAAALAAEEPVAGAVTAEGQAAAETGAESLLPAAAADPAADDADPVQPPGAAPAVPVATRVERRSHKRTPSFVRAPRADASPPARHAWRTPAAITLLACTLALQLLLADRASLAESKRWRPLITGLCAALQCSVPPWREVAAFTLLQRDVRPHPTRSGALRVTASFRNDARWPQPWPRLVLTLSDIDGREAGTRSFTASEYLGAAATQQELKSGQTATIAMDVLEPAPRIVAFTFDFN